LRAATPPLPDGQFDLVYVDPPWQFRLWSCGGDAFRPPSYTRMDLPSICKLPVARIAASDSVLAICLLGAGPAETLQVIQAWGFEPPYEGRVWVKASSRGAPRMGLGHTTRKDSESLWLARRGKGLVRQDAGVAQTIVAQRREHSRKPDEAYVRLERLYGDVRRIELFGRRTRPGWALWGNQVLAPDSEPFLPFAAGALDEQLAIPAEAAP
jgi:N6-adenosine-specific RNA methylase IME4